MWLISCQWATGQGWKVFSAPANFNWQICPVSPSNSFISPPHEWQPARPDQPGTHGVSRVKGEASSKVRGQSPSSLPVPTPAFKPPLDISSPKGKRLQAQLRFTALYSSENSVITHNRNLSASRTYSSQLRINKALLLAFGQREGNLLIIVRTLSYIWPNCLPRAKKRSWHKSK